MTSQTCYPVSRPRFQGYPKEKQLKRRRMTSEWGLKMIVLYHSSFQWGKVRGEERQLKLSLVVLIVTKSRWALAVLSGHLPVSGFHLRMWKLVHSNWELNFACYWVFRKLQKTKLYLGFLSSGNAERDWSILHIKPVTQSLLKVVLALSLKTKTCWVASSFQWYFFYI